MGLEGLEHWQGFLDELVKDNNSSRRRAMLDGLPDQFWIDLRASHKTLSEMSEATGLIRNTIRVHFKRLGIPWSRDTVTSQYRDPNEWIEAIETEIAGMGVGYDPVHLEKDKDWAIMPDVHGYNVDMQMFRRFLAVSKHYGITNLLGAGDFHDFAALSVFARDGRGYMPTVQDEISVTTKLEKLLAEQFTGDTYMMISNHELRLAKIIRHELQIEWLFERLFPQAKWVDCDHLFIGGEHDIRVIHPDKAWLNSYNLADDYARANECDVLMAHAHVFHFGYARSGRRIACIGGLFDPKAPGMRYYWRSTPRVKMQQGFVIYKDGNLLPFADGFVRWGDYGCE